MVPDQNKTSLGMEYFCNEGDEYWCMSDADLIELGKQEIAKIGLANYEDVVEGAVFRVEKTYPVYDSNYAQHMEVIKSYVSEFDNFQTIGRNGLHRYNNQDHAMLTGMLAVRNMLDGEQNDLWAVNAEQAYLEEIDTENKVKTDKVIDVVQGALAHVFPKLHPTALGLSVGIVTGFVLFVATWIALLQGSSDPQTNLTLLNQFFPGYEINVLGSVLGFFYGFLTGFFTGWIFAFLRNAATAFYLSSNFRSAQQGALRQFFDHM